MRQGGNEKRSFKRARQDVHLTQEGLAEKLSDFAEAMRRAGKLSREVRFSARQIRRWESADPPYPRPAHRRVLQEYFKRSPVELGFTPSLPVPDGTTLTAVSTGRHETQRGVFPHRREFAMTAATGTAVVAGPLPWTAPAVPHDLHGPKVGIDEVELLKATARDHDAIDQRLGSEVLWRTAHAHLGLVRHLCEQGSHSDAIGEELTLVAARLTTSLGWYAYDAGRQAEARVHLSEGLNAAMLGDDACLATRTLTILARQAIDLGAPREAVRFARSARQRALTWRTRPHAKAAPPRVMALIAIREAHGHAAGGDEAAFESAVRQAWTAFEQGTTDDDPHWVAFLNEAELTCLEGMARADAHQHRRAVRLLDRAGRNQSAEFARNRGMSLVRLAAATLACGDVDHAVAAGQETMNLMDRGVSSARIRRRLALLDGDLVPHAASPPVRDLRARLAEAVVGL